MRVSPTAYAANSLESVLELAERTAAVTHNHPDGILELRPPQAVFSWLELVIQNRKFEDLPLRSSIMNCLANWMKFATHILLMSLVPALYQNQSLRFRNPIRSNQRFALRFPIG